MHLRAEACGEAPAQREGRAANREASLRIDAAASSLEECRSIAGQAADTILFQCHWPWRLPQSKRVQHVAKEINALLQTHARTPGSGSAIRPETG